MKRILNRSEVVSLALTFYRSYRAWQADLNWATMPRAAMPPGGEAKLARARRRQSDYVVRLHTIVRLLRAAGITPVLLTQPTFGGPGRDPTTGEPLSSLWYGEFWHQRFAIYNATMRTVAGAEQVYLIDLARLMPRDTKYYYDPMHYTDAGASEVAAIVTDGMLPYLERKFPSFSKGRCAALSRVRAAGPR